MRTILEARKVRYETALETAMDQLDELSDTDIDSYRLDTGEGSQAVTQRSISQQQKHIMWLEAQIAAIDRRLNGTGIVNLTTRRRF